MAISILESDRVDRYELEVFVGQIFLCKNKNATVKSNKSKVNTFSKSIAIFIILDISYPLSPTRKRRFAHRDKRLRHAV